MYLGYEQLSNLQLKVQGLSGILAITHSTGTHDHWWVTTMVATGID